MEEVAGTSASLCPPEQAAQPHVQAALGEPQGGAPPSSAACARAAARHSTNEAFSDIQTGCAAQLQFTSLCLALSPSEKYCLSALSRNS